MAWKSRGWTWSRWIKCDRCGRNYPQKYIVVQDGLSVCTFTPCYDNPHPLAPAQVEPPLLTPPTPEDFFVPLDEVK